jgi:hypothetical protein
MSLTAALVILIGFVTLLFMLRVMRRFAIDSSGENG